MFEGKVYLLPDTYNQLKGGSVGDVIDQHEPLHDRRQVWGYNCMQWTTATQIMTCASTTRSVGMLVLTSYICNTDEVFLLTGEWVS